MAGEVSVMVFLGLCVRAKGTLHFVPPGQRANSAVYMDIITTVYEPDCHMHYGIPPDCVFQQDGASSHTAEAVQSYCREKFPMFWDKKSWPPNSPDLNVIDYFCWGYLQKEVTKQKPKCLDSLKLAIRRSVGNMPLEMVQRAILSFPKRVRMCIAAGGSTSKHRKYDEGLLEFPLLVDPEEAEGGELEEGGEADE